MNINRISNGGPIPSTPAENDVATRAEAPAAAPADASGLPKVTRAELHGPGQSEILQRTLMALLDRASESLGALPATSREKCFELLAADPLLSARLLSYLDQKAE